MSRSYRVVVGLSWVCVCLASYSAGRAWVDRDWEAGILLTLAVIGWVVYIRIQIVQERRFELAKREAKLWMDMRKLIDNLERDDPRSQ